VRASERSAESATNVAQLLARVSRRRPSSVVGVELKGWLQRVVYRELLMLVKDFLSVMCLRGWAHPVENCQEMLLNREARNTFKRLPR